MGKPKLSIFLIKTYLFWVFIVSLVLLLVGWLVEIFEVYRNCLDHENIPLFLPVFMSLLRLPYHFGKFLPFITIGSVVICLWKLNRTKELTALYSNGMSTWQLLSFFLVITFLISSLYVSLIQPLSASFLNIHQRINIIYLKKGITAQGKFHVNSSGIWIKENLENETYILHSLFKDINNKFYNITYYKLSKESKLDSIYKADSAVMKDSSFHLKDIKIVKSINNESLLSNVNKNINILKTSLSDEDFKNPVAKPEMLSIWRTSSFTNILEKSGLSGFSYWVFFHNQISLIIQCLSMALVGFIFMHLPSRVSSIKPISISFMTGFILYFINSFTQTLAYKGTLPILLAAWGVSGGMMFIGVITLIHKEGN